MCSLCRLPVAKNHNFGQLLIFGGLLYPPPFTARAKFGVIEQTQGLHFQAKFHLNVFIVSTSGGQKPPFWANFDSWGLLYRPPFTDEGQMWYAIGDPWYTFTCEISSRSVYSVVLCRRKTPIFGLRHLVMSPVGTSLRKLSTGAQLQIFPYKRHKIRLYTPVPSWRNRAHNL